MIPSHFSSDVLQPSRAELTLLPWPFYHAGGVSRVKPGRYERHRHSIEGELRVDTIGHRSANDASSEQS